MSIYAKMEGVTECLRDLDKAPQNMQNLVKKASKAASKKAANRMRGMLEPRWRDLCMHKVSDIKGKIVSIIGLFDRGEVAGHQPIEGRDPVFDWHKAYWNNYGTLAGRDPNHKFREPVKKRQTSTNLLGLQHKNFFEKAIADTAQVYEKEFLSYIANNKDKI